MRPPPHVLVRHLLARQRGQAGQTWPPLPAHVLNRTYRFACACGSPPFEAVVAAPPVDRNGRPLRPWRPCLACSRPVRGEPAAVG